MTSIDTDLDDLTAFMGQLQEQQTKEHKQQEEQKAGLERALAAARASEADLASRDKRHRSEDEKRQRATAPRSTHSSSGTSGSALTSSSSGSLLSVEWDNQIQKMNAAVTAFRRQLHEQPLQPLPIDQLRTRLLAPGVPVVFRGLPTTATLNNQKQNSINNANNGVGGIGTMSPMSPHGHLFVRHQSGTGDEDEDDMSGMSIPDSKLPATPDQGQRPINNKPPSTAEFANGIWTTKSGVPDSPDIFAAAGLNDEPGTRWGSGTSGTVKRMIPSKKNNTRFNIPEKVVKWSETNSNVADLTDIEIDEEKLARRGLTRDLREYDPRVPAGVAYVNGQWTTPGVNTSAEMDPFPEIDSSSPAPSLPPTPTRASLLSISLPRYGMSTLAECDEDAIQSVALDERAIKRLPATPNNKQIIGGKVPEHAVYVDGEWRTKDGVDEPSSPSWPTMDSTDLKPMTRDRIPVVTPSRQQRRGQQISEEWPLELPQHTVSRLPQPQKHMLINGNPPAGAHFIDGEWVSENPADHHVTWPDDGRQGKVNFRPIHDRAQPDLPVAVLDEVTIAEHVEHIPRVQIGASSTASMVNGEWTDASSSAEDVEWPDDDDLPSAPEAPIPIAKSQKVGIGAHGVNHQHGNNNINDESMDDVDVDDQFVDNIVQRLPVKNNNDIVNPQAPSNASFVNGQWISNTGAEPELEWPEDLPLKAKSPATPMRPLRNDTQVALQKTPSNNNHDDDTELELDDGGLDHLVATRPTQINHGEAGRGPAGTAFVNGAWIRITDEVDEPEWPDDVHDVDPLVAYAQRDGRDHEQGIPEIGEDAFVNFANNNRLKGVGLVAKDAQFIGGKWVSTNAQTNDDVEWPDIDSNDSVPRAAHTTNPTPPRAAGHHRSNSSSMTPSSQRYQVEQWNDVEIDTSAPGGKLATGVVAVSNRVPTGVRFIDGKWVGANTADDDIDPFGDIIDTPAPSTSPPPHPSSGGHAGGGHGHAPPPGSLDIGSRPHRRSIISTNPLARWQERDGSDGDNSEAGELEDAIALVAEHGIKLKPLAEHEMDDDGFPTIEHTPDEAQMELQKKRQMAAARQAAAIAAKKNGGAGLSLTTGGSASSTVGAGGAKRHSAPATHLTIGPHRSGISPQPSPRFGPNGAPGKKSMTLPGAIHTGSHAELDEFDISLDKEQEMFTSQRENHRALPPTAARRADTLISEPLSRDWLMILAKELEAIDASRPTSL